MNVSLYILLSFIAAATSPESRKGAAAIEQKVLAYRRAMQCGHLVLTHKTYIRGVYAPRDDRVTTLWFDGSRIRNDEVFRYDNAETTHREVRCNNCERSGHRVMYNDIQIPIGRLALTLRKAQPSDSRETYSPIDPRLLGMAPESVPNLIRANLETWVGRSDRSPPSCQRLSWKELDAWRIDYVTLKGRPVRMWMVPAYGPSLARLETELDVDGQHYFFSVESAFRQHATSGLWFPSTVTSEQHIDGVLEEKEVVDVQVVSLNEPLDPVVFTLAGMDIPKDTPITGIKSSDGSTFFWNGKEIVPQVEQPRNKYTSNPTTRRWLFIVNAVFLALVAAVLFWRSRRQQKPG